MAVNQRLVCLLAVGLLAVAAVNGARIPGADFKEQLSLRDLQSARISPDGTQVAFQVRSTDWEDNRFDEELWVAPVAGGGYPLTRTPDGSSNDPQWSPDSRWIAFTADRGEKSQIHLIRAGGGEASPVTAQTEGIGGFLWSPDGGRIAFLRSQDQSKSDKQREERYGRFAVEDHEYRQQHLWVVDVSQLLTPNPDQIVCFPEPETDAEEGTDPAQPAGETTDGDEPVCKRVPVPQRLTEGDFTVRSPSWSPDGRWIAFERRDNPQILSFETADIYLLEVATGETRPLVTGPGFDGNPVWSPDSRWILYSSSRGNTTSNFYRNNSVLKIPVEGGSPYPLATDFDENISVVDWKPTGIYFTAWQRMQRRLFHLDPNDGGVRPVSDEPDRVWSVSFSRDGTRAGMVAERPGGLDELYTTAVNEWKPLPLTRMSDQIAGWPLGSREVVSWESRDGTQVEGVLYKPANFDPGRKYPLFVVIHGGPTGIDYPGAVPGTVYPILQWLEKGALVLRPNYRGSAGYGEAFRALNVRNLGVGDAWDVLSGVDYLIQLGFVDSDRMGAMGWSQGGYISAFLTTNSDRFKAISVGAGISDWTTYYVNTDIHPFTRQYLQATPWADPEIYARTSPMTHIRNASTPTLIQHGGIRPSRAHPQRL